MSIRTLFFCDGWFWITNYCLIFSAFAEGSVFRTESRESIWLFLYLNSFRSSWVDRCCFNNSHRYWFHFISCRFWYFLEIEVIDDSFAGSWACMIGYFLVEILIIKFLSSLLKDNINGVSGWMYGIVDRHD